MSRRRRKKEPEPDPNVYVPVSKEHMDYWADSHVGGSGLSIGIQKDLRNMAIELREFREREKQE